MAHFPPQNGYPSYRNQHQMLQQPQGNVLRQNIADRSVRDSFLSVTNCPTNNLNLQRDNSMKQLYDTCGTRYSENVYALPVQPNHQPPHTHRDFSDYQLAFSNVKESVVPKQVVGVDNLPRGGGKNIANFNKSSEKTKDLERSSLKLVESGIFGDSRRTSKVPIDQNCTRDNINYELLGAEVSKVVERIAKNQQKIAELERTGMKKSDFSDTKLSELPLISEIRFLVQQAKISQERMRQNFYVSLAEIKQELRHTLPKQEFQQQKELIQVTIAKEMEKIAKTPHPFENVIINMDLKLKGSFEKFKALEQRITEIQANFHTHANDNVQPRVLKSGSKQFAGKMTSFIYEQRIRVHHPPPIRSGSTGTSNNMNRSITMSGLDDKQNGAITFTSKIYYIDNNGYLLDKNKYYLLDRNNEQIKLSDQQIDFLRQHNILDSQ